MKKQNLFKYFCISFLCVCIFAQPIGLYAQQVSVGSTTVEQYLERIKVLQKQIDYLGQTAYITESKGESADSLLKDIAFAIREVQNLLEDIQANTKGISPTSREGRSVSYLIIILNYFSNALNELNLYLITNDDYEEFDALEGYLYNKTISNQTISWLANNL